MTDKIYPVEFKFGGMLHIKAKTPEQAEDIAYKILDKRVHEKNFIYQLDRYVYKDVIKEDAEDLADFLKYGGKPDNA